MDNEWKEWFTDLGAFWTHDGNPQRPHVVLNGGEHSGGFFNSQLILEDARLTSKACRSLIEKLPLATNLVSNIDRVIGPAYGGIVLAHEIARQISDRYNVRCLSGFTEKSTIGEHRAMALIRTNIRRSEVVLLVEDTVTTGKNTLLTANAITNDGGVLMLFVLALVNRSGLKKVGGKEIIALVDEHMPTWSPEDCPLCKQGSVALHRPK